MNRISAVIGAVLALLVTDASSSFARRPLEDLFPSNTIVFLSLQNPSETLEGLEKSSFGRFWNDPELSSIITPFKESLDLQSLEEDLSTVGLSFSQMKEILTGQVAFGFTIAEEDREEQLMLVVEAGDKVEELIEAMANAFEAEQEKADGKDYQLREVEEDFLGFPVTVREKVTEEELTEEVAWSVADGFFFAGSNRETIEALLSAFADENEEVETLSSHPGFAQAQGDGFDGFLFVSFENALPGIKKALAEQSEGSPGVAMGLTPDVVLDAMGFEDLDAIFMTMDVHDDGIGVDLGFQYEKLKGLMRALAFQPGAPPSPSWIPDHALGAYSARYSIPEVWAGIEETMLGLNPMVKGLVDMQFQQILAQSGIQREIDLKKSCLEPLADELHTFKIPGTVGDGGDASSVVWNGIGVGVKDSATLATGLADVVEVLKAIGANFGQTIEVEEQEFLGTTLRTLSLSLLGGAFDAQVHFALSPNYLFISPETPEPIKEVLVAESRTGKGFWDRSDVEKALERLPEGASAWSYEKSGSTSLRRSLDELATLSGVDSPEDIDLEKIVGYFGPVVAGVYPGEKELILRLRILNPAEEE